jgi:hypothetical protein
VVARAAKVKASVLVFMVVEIEKSVVADVRRLRNLAR